MNQGVKKILYTKNIEVYGTRWICDYFEDGSPRKCRLDPFRLSGKDSGIYYGRRRRHK